MKRPSLPILFDDADLVAINKPADLAVVPGGGAKRVAIAALAEQLGLAWKGADAPRLRPVHRIDKDTSGVVLFAKNRPAQQAVSIQFQNNKVEKTYLALVAGEPGESEGEIDKPLARDESDRTRMRIARHGRPALTTWKVRERFRGLCLLEVFPRTGKTHQIRVHLASVGLPLAVDPLYGRGATGVLLSQFKRDYRAKRDVEERPLISRLTLHAERLSLMHPDGSPLQIEAELPKDFRATLNMLSKYARR